MERKNRNTIFIESSLFGYGNQCHNIKIYFVALVQKVEVIQKVIMQSLFFLVSPKLMFPMNKYQPAKIALWAWNSWPATHKQQSVNREFSHSPPNSSANRHSGTFTIFMVFWPEMLTESCTTLTCERQGNTVQSFCYQEFSSQQEDI